MLPAALTFVHAQQDDSTWEIVLSTVGEQRTADSTSSQKLQLL
jgi:hypothetical protein